MEREAFSRAALLEPPYGFETGSIDSVTQLAAAFCSALSAGALDRMPARCAAKIEARAWMPSDVSPPLRISADRAPMQPSAERIGATTAPLEPLGREGTICSTPERYAAAAALLAERGTGGMRAIISGL